LEGRTVNECLTTNARITAPRSFIRSLFGGSLLLTGWKARPAVVCGLSSAICIR